MKNKKSATRKISSNKASSSCWKASINNIFKQCLIKVSLLDKLYLSIGHVLHKNISFSLFEELSDYHPIESDADTPVEIPFALFTKLMNHLGACNSDAIDLSDGPVCRRDSPVEGLSDTVLQLEIDKADLEDRVKDATKLLTSLNVRSLMDGHELALATEQDPYSDTHFASTFPPLKNQYHETPQASTLREVRSVANLHAHKCGSVRIIAGMVPIFD